MMKMISNAFLSGTANCWRADAKLADIESVPCEPVPSEPVPKPSTEPEPGPIGTSVCNTDIVYKFGVRKAIRKPTALRVRGEVSTLWTKTYDCVYVQDDRLVMLATDGADVTDYTVIETMKLSVRPAPLKPKRFAVFEIRYKGARVCAATSNADVQRKLGFKLPRVVSVSMKKSLKSVA